MPVTYSRFHLADHELLRNLAVNLSRDRAATAELLADLAEVDARELYAPAAYTSMKAYCEGELGMSPDAAAKRIQAARAARDFPALFAAVADGRLNLSGVGFLAPHLSAQNSDELISAAAGLSCAALKEMLAARFPRPDVAASVRACGVSATSCQHATSHVPATQDGGSFELTAPEPVERQREGVAPTAAQRWSVSFTADQELHDALQYARALCAGEVKSSDVAGLVKLALDALIASIEKRRFGAHTRHGRRRGSDDPRHVPTCVKHEVWLRDRGQCTFVSEGGKRCGSRARLEYDHVEPVARGGRSTVANLRLRCRTHNQLAAEQLYGRAFMEEKREATRAASAEQPNRNGASPGPPATLDTDARLREQEVALERGRAEQAAREAAVAEVIPVLRSLGATAERARTLAAPCADMPNASLQERLGVAFRGAGPARRAAG